MRNLDSRGPSGGIYPLQAHEQAFKDGKVIGRASLIATRFIDSDDWGIPIEDPICRGDMSGFIVVKPAAVGATAGSGATSGSGPREIPTWREVFPVIRVSTSTGTDATTTPGGTFGDVTPNSRNDPPDQVVTPSASGATPVTGATSGDYRSRSPVASNVGPDTKIQPTKGDAFKADDGMETITVPTRTQQPYWPAFPRDAYALIVGTMDADRQVVEYVPTEPRLVSVNAGTAVACGTIVSDLAGDAFDPSRAARLHSMIAVVKAPRGALSLGASGVNELAWNIGLAQQGDALGGLVRDQDRLALVSVRDGGIVDCGRKGDKHAIGTDDDGHQIATAHVPTSANFTDGGSHDGPIHFETPWPSPVDAPYVVLAHIGYDAGFPYTWPRDSGEFNARGKWRLWSTSLVGETPKTINPVTPGGRPNPGTPGGGDGGGGNPTTPGGDPGAPTGSPTPGPSAPAPYPLAPSGPGDHVVTPPGFPFPLPAPRTPRGGRTGGGLMVDPSNPLGPLIPTTTPTGDTVVPPITPGGLRVPSDADQPIPTIPGYEPPFLPGYPGFSGPRPGPPVFIRDNVIGQINRGNSRNLTARSHAVMTAELATPGLLIRPQRYVQGEIDTRYKAGYSNVDAVAKVEARTPVAGRLSAWGAQGGQKGGPYLTNSGGGTQVGANDWLRTQDVNVSREVGGTVPGGMLLLPPEIDLSDIDDGLAPAGVTLSPTYFATGPGAYFGAGIPELATGGLRSGVRWGLDGTDLVHSTVDSVGVATEQMRLEPGQITFPASFDLVTGSTYFLTRDEADGLYGAGGGTTFANPTAVVGGAAINGSSTNAMRADGAPALGPLTRDLDFGGFKATNAANPTSAQHLTTRAYVEANFQPLDSDLTAIAAVSTTSYGRSFLALANAAAGQTLLSLGTLATQSGTFSGTSSGTNTGDQTSVSGNAGTATALQTARNINGVSFNGTAPITIGVAASDITGASADAITLLGAFAKPTGWSSATGTRRSIATGASLADVVEYLGTLAHDLLSSNVFGA